VTEHPEELLAAYVDGDLAEEERAEVTAHLSTCATCREEAALAEGARAALASLEEVPAPAGLGTPAIQRARPERRWMGRLGWVAAGAAAAALVGVFAWTGLKDDAITTDAVAPAPESVEEDAAPGGAGDAAAGPFFVATNRDYHPDSVRRLAVRLAAGDREAFGSSTSLAGPQPSPVENAPGDAGPDDGLLQALACIDRAGIGADEEETLLYIEAARFEERRAYVVAFSRGGDAPRISLWVLDRRICSILYVANQAG
jgi:hypothetical protein